MSTNKQAREELRKRYTPPEIPNCSICGASLSIQRCGGGEPTVYACDGYEADPENPGMVRRAAGRDIADKHYEESRYIDWKKGGDSDVVALLDELEAANELVELQRFKLERQAEDLHQAKSLEGIHRERRLEVEREFRDYKDRAESNQMRLAKEVCRLEDELQAAGIVVKGE